MVKEAESFAAEDHERREAAEARNQADQLAYTVDKSLGEWGDKVPEAEKTRRILALQQLQREIQLQWHASMVGREVEVLVDGPSRRRAWEVAGRTSGNTIVNFPGPDSLIGALVRVRVTEGGPNSLRGELAGVVEPAVIGATG